MDVVFSYHMDRAGMDVDTLVDLALFGGETMGGEVSLQATVTFHRMPAESGGGSIVSVRSGHPVMVHSPNYPLPYPKGAEANWQFEAPEGFRIVYELEHFVGASMMSTPWPTRLSGTRRLD